jgi:hypothetical protein
MFNDGAFELLDAHELLPGLKARKGLLTWPVSIMKNDIASKVQRSDKTVNEKDLFNIYYSYLEFLEKHPR